MKINKYVEDLKAKTSAELNEELVAAKKELFNLRFQNATNQLWNAFISSTNSSFIQTSILLSCSILFYISHGFP